VQLSNTERGKAFQILCGAALKRALARDFDLEVAIGIGGAKLHAFDLATREQDIIAQCKNFDFTATGNNPSAKITTLREAAMYLQRLQKADARLLIVRHAPHPKRGETLGRYFVRLNKHLLEGITVLEMPEGGGDLVCIHGAWRGDQSAAAPASWRAAARTASSAVGENKSCTGPNAPTRSPYRQRLNYGPTSPSTRSDPQTNGETMNATQRLHDLLCASMKECPRLKPPYHPTEFMQLLERFGAVGAVIAVIMPDKPTSGFSRLWEANRLDLTAESILVRHWDEIGDLFVEVPDILEKAKRRLKQFKK
jgi:hypothetical protein